MSAGTRYEQQQCGGSYGMPFGKPFAIIITILAFIAWWPLGLVMLAVMIWSGKMGWHSSDGRWERKLEHLQSKMDRVRERMQGGGGNGGGWGRPSGSGNRAFDEYREETLRRLEDEQREFRAFLDRLRFAKDKTEFDAFMAERRSNAGQSGQPNAGQQQG